LLVSGVAVSQLWLSLIGFLLMFAGAYFAFTKPNALPGDSAPAAPKKTVPRKPGLSERFQKRFEERDGL
jgi:uncharacterized membrane protein